LDYPHFVLLDKERLL